MKNEIVSKKEILYFINDQINKIKQQHDIDSRCCTIQYFVGAEDAYRTVLTKIDLMGDENDGGGKD